MPVDYSLAEATAVLETAASALVTLKNEVAAATAKLEPLTEENESLKAVVADLKAADLAVDEKIFAISEILNPPAVEPEPEPEPVVEPTE